MPRNTDTGAVTFSHDAVVGAIAGGAIGDALGGVLERGGLSLSDDTQLTLATCEAIVDRGAVAPEAVAGALLRWYRARAIVGIGSSTLKAVRDLDAGAHWALSGARGEMAAGNGAAMRIAPLAFTLDPFSTEARTTIRDICRITHHSDEAYIGALAVLVAMHSTPSKSGLFGRISEALPDSRVRDRMLNFSGISPSASLDCVAEQYGASGYVVETVPLAVLLAHRMVRDGFAQTIQESAEIAGDADTICAIGGQIAGVELGLSQLPGDLLNLEPVTQAVEAGERFAAVVARAG